jgi:hypothetical protein
MPQCMNFCIWTVSDYLDELKSAARVARSVSLEQSPPEERDNPETKAA